MEKLIKKEVEDGDICTWWQIVLRKGEGLKTRCDTCEAHCIHAKKYKVKLHDNLVKKK